MKQKIKFTGIDNRLLNSVTEISEMLGFEVCDSANISVNIVVGESLSIKEERGGVVIGYKKQNEIYRALSLLPAFLADKKEVKQSALYQTLCFMADMSRNAVYNIESAKRMIRYLAIMGYTSLMLYTEDTYELPDYKYFGHMRGRFTENELKEIDDYAYGFGIEVIPCIQTLAHLSTAIRWSDLEAFKDTDDILCVGDEETYKFVEAILIQCAKCFRTKRIHLGMDEAHNLGLGRYLKKNGYKKTSDIILEHLERVTVMCKKYNLEPMIWSDMFFRMAFGGKARVSEGEIPPEVVAKVPEGLNLVYWDYYSYNPKTVDHMVNCHKKFKNPMTFAGGAWKWNGFGAHNMFSIKFTQIQLDVMDKHGVTDIIVTAWGDNGGEASQFSVLASMLLYAERSYHRDVDSALLNKRALECFDISFDGLLAFDLPDSIPGCEPEKTNNPLNPSKYLLYNDILEGFFDRHIDRETACAAFAENAEKLLALKNEKNFGYAFETLGKLCHALELKCDLGIRIRAAYNKNDNAALEKIVNDEIPEVIARIKSFLDSYYRQWHIENKSFGFSAQEIRIGGLMTRLEYCAKRLKAYLAGEIKKIEELESSNLPLIPLEKDAATPYIRYIKWDGMVKAGIL